MQASDTKDASRAALYTSLKCGIPVAVLAGFVVLCFSKPDEFEKALGFIFGLVTEGGMLAMIGFFSFLGALGSVIYPLAVAVICGFLWSACAINNLKTKGLTGSLYGKIRKAFVCLSRTLFITMGLWFVFWVNELITNPAMYGVVKLWAWMGLCIALCFVHQYTYSKNSETPDGDSNDDQ